MIAADSRTHSDKLLLFATVCIYIVVTGALLIYSDGLPFVFDNGESFSVYWHSHNAFTFGFWSADGLADESFSSAAAAHPFVYTHAGTMPRLWGMLLYAVGCRIVEAQIVVTALSIGLMALIALWFVLRRISDATLATLTAAILATDYICYTQWQLGTWQIWKSFFFFVGLWLAHEFGTNSPGWRRLVGITLFFLLLYYFEHIFNIFITICTTLIVLLNSRRLRPTFTWIVCSGTGAMISGAILLSQVTAHLGIHAALQDIYFTFIGRNFAADPASFLEQVRAFYTHNNIVYWMNVPDSAPMRSRDNFRFFWAQNLSIYSPFFMLSALGAFAAFALASVDHALARVSSGQTLRWLRVPRVGGTFETATVIATVLVVFLATWVGGEVLIAVASLGLPIGIILWLFDRLRPGPSEPKTEWRWIKASAFVWLAWMSAICGKHALADAYLPLREAIAGAGAITLLQELIAVTLIILAGTMAAIGPSLRRAAGRSRPLFVLIISSFVSMSLVFLLFPGYTTNGYIARFAPLTVYLTGIVIGVGLWTLWLAAGDGVTRVSGGGAATSGRLIAGALILGVPLAWWARTQVFYLSSFPPDFLSFMTKLSEPPFVGSSFALNGYGAPVAYYTGRWAYLDPALGQGSIEWRDGCPTLPRDHIYLWFADRGTNREYNKPAYYLHFFGYSLDDLVFQLAHEKAGVPVERVGTVPLIAQARAGTLSDYGIEELAKDETGEDRWSILKLGWAEIGDCLTQPQKAAAAPGH